MSAQAASRRLTAASIRSAKGGEPIVALTAYDAITAALADAHADFLLVGDSLGMVVAGHPTTVPVTLDDMIFHGRAVVGATARALVVVDMPFGSYEAGPEDAFRNAARILKETGCGAVKLEGGRAMADTIAFLVARGVPVMGHVGLTPQSINVLGSFRAVGRTDTDADRVEADARAVAEAGAFALVVEAVMAPLAGRLTQAVPVPTIGIGASAACDGQILVTPDMLGLTERAPKFVRRYADLRSAMAAAFGTYASDVKARRFPGPENEYKPKS